MQAKKFQESNLDFTFQYSKVLLTQNQRANVFISPMSISMALATLYFGADKNSKLELEKALNFQDISGNSLQDCFENLFEYLRSSSTTSTVTSMLIQQDIKLKQTYIHLLDKFNAKLSSVNFFEHSDQITKDVNLWVEKQTHGKIPNLLDKPFDPNTKAFIVNAVYFKGFWTRPFKNDMTHPEDFYNNGEDVIQVPMMVQTNLFSLIHDQDSKATIVQLPYEDLETSMIIFLPNDKNGLPQLVNRFTSQYFKEICMRLNETIENKMILSLPKFKLEFGQSLVDSLKLLGISEIFDPNVADLSQISELGDLFVSEILHKSIIEVDEKGTEAAAATGIKLMTRSMPFSLKVNHPFLFVIYNKQMDTVLFLGRVCKL